MVTEDEVYKHVSWHTWKTGREIRQELLVEKGIDKDMKSEKWFRSFFAHLRGPGYVPIYRHLRNLTEQKLIEKRNRDLPEEVLRERGIPLPEYRRIANRGKPIEKTEEASLIGRINPAYS